MDEDSDNPRPRPRPTRNLPSRQAKIKAPARATRATAAYFTSSSNTQTSASPSPSSSPETDTHTPARNLRPRRKKRKARAISATQRPPKSRRLEPTIDETPSDAVDNTLLSAASVPIPFHTLPYHVLQIIFHFIAAPIRNPASRIDDYTEAINTLLSAARTCKYTIEPALAVLYKCPPFHRAYNKSPQASFIQFLQTLALDPSQTLIRYRPKVHILRLDVDALLNRRINGHQLQLKQVLKHLPRLACLELYHPADDPPYRDLDTHLRGWRLSKDDLLDGLGPPLLDRAPSDGDKTETTLLKSWWWNARLVSTDLSLDHLPEVHSLPAFRNVRKLAFVNYQLPSTTHFAARARQSQEAQNRDVQAITQLAISISALPDLQHLVIESSTLASGSLLERLPKTLTHLELVNCWEITSEDLSKFLMSHGKSLTQLTLKYCQSLSLGFLPVLGTSCPNLTHLEVDLSYFRHHESYADNKPEYATLLDVDDVPTWPSSIQSIEIINMRNWTREAAEMFFGSLMKNARAMPNLRRLEFKVILNIEWRQRQEMRRSLANQMTKVFKRKSTPPKERKTLRQFGKDDDNSEDELAGPTTALLGNKRRIRPAKKTGSKRDEFIQGLCDVVDIQVDNQRPAERQYEMDDFLDTPDESDPDWNSDED
ncbi:hypothetical protein F4678DRAFT_231935 [Xylaria arbuscula]|nr:hypothetical protein F4678DRAFT_231935 [Xylaria arbuscula]